MKGWSYEHSIGVIAIEGWGDPFLVIDENKFWNGQSWGYNYYRLGASFADENDAKKEAARLNEEFNMKGTRYNSQQSEELLLSVQQKFPQAKIAA